MSFKSDVGETQGVIHPERKLFSCEPVKPENLCASIMLWWGRQRIDIPFTKGGKIGKREWLIGPKKV